MVIDKFLGIYNTVNERDIPDGALQDAVDVDITNAGGLVARTGYQLALSVPVTTAYTTIDEKSYLISDGVLYQVGSSLSLTRICPSTATEFADYSGIVFTNDGLKIAGLSSENLIVSTPSAPNIVITAGSKSPGAYAVLTTFTNADGLEGGTSPVVRVELESEGDILVTPDSRTGYETNVYLTEPNGSVFFNAATGRRLIPALINANPFPENATKIEYHESRLYVAEPMGDYTVVWYSDPLMFHIYGNDDGYFIIPGDVLDMRSTNGGLVIGTENEIYAYEDGVLTLLTAYGVVKGRPMLKLPDRSLLIHTPRGVAKALPFEQITGGKTSLYMGGKCSTHLVNARGIRKYVATHDSGDSAYNRFQ